MGQSFPSSYCCDKLKQVVHKVFGTCASSLLKHTLFLCVVLSLSVTGLHKCSLSLSHTHIVVLQTCYVGQHYCPDGP